LGPDLSRWRGTEEFFRRAMTHPDEEIDPKYRRVVLALADGRVLTGIRVYEDAYYLLLIDGQEQLRTIPRPEIEELAMPKQSLMRSLAQELSDDDLRDLYAHVYSLAEKPTP
jgi:putative heme-binding domain-containing protein